MFNSNKKYIFFVICIIVHYSCYSPCSLKKTLLPIPGEHLNLMNEMNNEIYLLIDNCLFIIKNIHFLNIFTIFIIAHLG